MSETAGADGTVRTGTLTVKELKEIRERLTKVYALVSSHKMVKLPPTVNEDIARIAGNYRKDNEAEKDLFGLACLIVTISAWTFYKHKAEKYVDMPHIDMEDLYHVFFELVYAELPTYRGETDMLTFFKPRVNTAFASARASGRGASTTKHYLDAGVKIKHAKDELAKIGNDNPSVEDIYEYIAGTEKKEVAITTIKRYTAQHPDFLPIDLSKIEVLGGEKIKGPEEEYVAKEDKMTFYRVMSNLPKQFLLIVKIELDYEDKYGQLPSIQQIYKILTEDLGYKYTEKRVSNMVVAANQQVRRYYKWRQEQTETPVNRVKVNEEEMKNETDDVFDALDEDPDDMFEDW